MEEVFAQRLRLALKERGMTQTELADALGVGRWIVCNWCTGRHTPRAYFLPEIAMMLRVSLDWLFGMDEYTKEEER